METFYLALSRDRKNCRYTFLKEDKIAYETQRTVFEGLEYTWHFEGILINKEDGVKRLNNKGIKFNNDKEYILGLFKYFRESLNLFISKNSFLLIDDYERVYIHAHKDIYYARERRGIIHISSDMNYIKESHIFKLKENHSLMFLNNNLKTI